MARSPNFKFSGLFTSANAFSEAPAGAFGQADNVVIRDQSIVEPMRGYKATASNPSGSMTRVFPFQGKLLTVSADGHLRTYSNGAWNTASAWVTAPPDATNPIRSASAAKSLFLTSSSGVLQVDKLDANGYASGDLFTGVAPPAFLSASTSNSGSVWLGTGSSVAYVAVGCAYDANNNLIVSSPCQPLTVTGASGTNATATITVSSGSGVWDVTFFFNGGRISVDVTGSYNTSDNQTAADVSAAINASSDLAGLVSASVSTNTVTVTAVGFPGAAGNSVANVSMGASGTGVAGTVFSGGASGALSNVTVTMYLPGQYTYPYTFFQLYRTATVGAGSSPNAEYFQVAEHTVTSTDRSNGYLTFQVDITPDGALGGALYCNAITGSTPSIFNDQPPLARDLCAYGSRMLYANTTTKQTLDLTLIGTAGLVSGTSTIVIAGVTYKAASSENPAITPPAFKLYTTGTATQNVVNTAKSLCRTVTRYCELNTGSVYALVALYVGGTGVGGDNGPGAMLFQEAGMGGTTFSINTGTASQMCWSPDLSSTSTFLVSNNDPRPARLWWSNDGLPWAVDSSQWADVGAADQAILRLILVRQTVFIFKQDGLYFLQGGTPENYSILPFDPSLVLLAPESCTVVGNQVYCLTNRGYVVVSESGVTPAVDRPIERDIRAIQSQATQYTTSAFGVAYENEGWALMALPASALDTGCSQQYVLHAAFPSNGITWTRWLVPNAVHGCLDPTTNALVWIVGNKLYQERKNFNSTDLQWPDGSGITCTVKPLPVAFGDPLFKKHFQTLFLSFKDAQFVNSTVTFDGNVNNTVSTSTKSGPQQAGWGTFPWGTPPWTQSTRNFKLRADVPQACALSEAVEWSFTTSEAMDWWQLQGFCFLYEQTTQMVTR